MKNSNLLNRLLSYSHEKQSPQRFGRYAVMLLMLLTLGVGQMWADSSVTSASIKYDVNASTAQWWNVSSTPKDLGQVYTFKLKGFWAKVGSDNVCQNTCIYYGLTNACSMGNYNIQDPKDNNWTKPVHFQTESMNVDILSGRTPDKYILYAKFIGHGTKGSNSCADLSSSTYQMKFEYPAYLTGDGTWCGTEWNTTADAQKMTYDDGYYTKTISSVTKADHKLKVATYNWGSSWGHAKYDATNSSNVYSEADDGSGNILFQPAMAGDVTIKFNISDQKISIICTAPTITLDDEGGSGGSGTQNTYYNVATSNVSVPTRTGYIFEGYYDGDDGTGNQIINASGVWQKNKSNFTDNSSTPKWIVRANHTLHAKWTPVTWKLQSTLGDHGTFTGTGPYTLDVTYNSATMNWGAARFDLNGTSYICNNYTIGTSGKLDLRAENAYTGITGMTNGASYTFTITYESGTWYVQIAENCTAPTIAWNTTPANGVAGGNMTASVTTNQTSPTITWNSSNTSAATVNSSGVITYVAAGNTRITASYTGDGSTYCSTTASVYQDITVSAAVADAWSLWYWGGSETKIGDFTPDGGDSHHLDFELTASNFETLWLKNNSTQYVATNINANTVTNVTVTESPTGRFRDDATKGYYRFTIYKDGGGAWKLDASPIYRVTYNDNGATSGTAPTDAAGYVSGATVTVKGNTGSLAKTGYDFGGWNLAANGSGTNYTAGSGTFSITANTELFAKWNVQSYTITYKDQGNVAFSGSHVDTPSAHPTTHTYGTATTLNSATKTGYTFGGWFDNSSCTGEAVISLGATTYSDDITLYAKWTENMTTVTINANPAGAGTFTVDASAFTEGNTTTAGVATSHMVVTTAQTGYKFSSWGTSGNATGTSSTNTYTLKGNGSGSTGTLTANFSRLYAYVQGRFQVKNAARNSNTMTYASGGQWNESSTNIQMEYDDTNHRFVLHTHMTPSELTANHGTGCDDCKPYFYIKTSTSNSSLAGVTTYMCTSAQTLTTAGSANGKTVSSSSGSNTNLRFNSSTTSGYAVVYFDQSKIWYELEQRLQYDANGGSGTAPTGDNGHNSYHAKDANATAEANTFTARKNYTFAGWNTAADITGTSYAAGASVPMSADRILYAKWNRSVTLDQQDATTPGSTSVIATWNCSTLPTINNPEKTGYDFGGWYTETAGNGNIIINTSGQLQASKTNWTVDGGKFQRTPSSDASESKPLYAKWTQTVTLNANTANHGSGDNTSATIVYKAIANTSITHCTPASGYHLEGYYTAATDGVKVLNADGSFASSAVTDYITDGKWTKAGATTLYAHYEPNTYDVILNVNGATSGSDQTVVATFDDDMPTTQKTSGDAITAPSKTGYTFGGYWTNNTGTGTQYYTNALASNHIWDVATNNTHIYAKWTANPYTVTLTQSGETGYGSAGTASVTATYDAALPTISSLPTAANGYAFMGYYTDHNGTGTQYYGADGTKLVATYTTADALELFAYFKKAEITNLVAAPGVIAPGETITITPTIEPTPTGTTKVCYELQYSNGTPLPSQPEFSSAGGNAVSFTAPAASATYIIQATLETGDDCGNGTELSTRTTTFQVAGEHTVTVRYQDSDGRTLAASEEIAARPLTWTTDGDIMPPTITGYTFVRWDAGDGVTIKNGDSDPVTTTTTSSIQIKAVYDGTLTAVYNKKKLIFFNNTLGWSDVYVYFYNTNKYWNDAFGAGAKKEQGFGDGEAEHPYWEEEHGHMTQIEGTNIWYFDYEGAGYSTRANVAFTEGNQHTYQWFNYTKAVVRGDHGSSLQMFVPLTTKTTSKNNTDYYNHGYWMNYPENTGYSLLIYNQKAKYGATKLYEIPFEFTEDYTMPMELTVDLEAGQTYGFEIKRADGTYYSTTTTITANTSNWGLYKDQTSYCGLQTTAAGNYTFSLFYDGEYRVGVTYPVAVNDYRIVYTDLATWSKTAHTASWNHPSRVITKNSSATEVKKDTVSFFWTYGSTPAIKYQTCTAVAAGSASWNAGTAIDVSGFSSVLTKKGVYNFIFEQPAGGASISLVGVEPYTGNYYIRTDCAGSTKWANFRSLDHQMTYSDYTEEHSGYSHYYAHWVTSGTNVKFCIANDYSMCITDTLVEDKGTVIANITAEGNANAGRLNSGNASIRFMWDYKTNKVSRAYISGSTNVSDRFLVLEGDSKMYDKDGSALSISGLNPNEANLIDDQNFVYEREIQVNTKARAKLTAKYNTNIQYFKGSEGAFAEGTTIELLGGDADGKHTMRIVYDFKTNRLVTAYVPSGTIDAAIAINADLMIVREHQEAGQQLLFNGGSLSEVHTVYGVMRFNRWTLNNKSTADGHSPVGDPKSIYERSLYWISFPFDVKLSDVFGFGTYGVDWIIEYYDGAERATNGYWVDSDGFWKMVMPAQRANFTLEAGKGYVLAIDVDAMKDNNTTFWANNIEQVELFFPSAANVENITQTTAHTTVPEHECTIDRRTDKSVNNINKDRTKADSHWNMIGIPSYANYGATLTSDEAGTHTITWNSNPYTTDLPFLYEWNMTDDSYTVQSGTTYPFKAMHSYMVQYHGDLYWSLASATPTPSPIVARRAYAEKPQNAEFRLELQQNEKMVDQTFVKLSNDENVSTNFAFDEDLCKEYNANKANIYTVVENYLPVAGNTMPMSDQTTVVPVGVKIAADGEYTFAIPEGTEGIGVVLIDNIAGTRTNLGLMDYSVTLEQGQIDNRFLLEISPIVQSPTGIELLNGENGENGVRKVLIDNILYIVKGGIVYDAQGHRVQ